MEMFLYISALFRKTVYNIRKPGAVARSVACPEQWSRDRHSRPLHSFMKKCLALANGQLDQCKTSSKSGYRIAMHCDAD